MKTFAKFLLAGGLVLGASLMADQASAQHCHSSFPGRVSAPSRFVHFRVDGRAFSFDRVTSGIFCDGVKIGQRLPNGEVTIFEGALPATGGAQVVGGSAVGGASVGGPVIGGPAVGGVPAGGPAVGNPGPNGAPGQGAAPVGQPAGGPGVAPGNPGAPAASGAPGAGVAPSAPGASGVAPALSPAPASAAPLAVPSLGSGNDPLAAAAQSALPQINVELLNGQWRAETKDIAGRVVVRELSFDEENVATLRIQAQGQDPISIQGPFEMKEGQFIVSEGEEKRPLGQFTTVEQDRLVLQGEGETVTFTRVEEAAE